MKLSIWIAVAAACLGVLVALSTGVQAGKRAELSALIKTCSDRAYQFNPAAVPFNKPHATEIMQFEIDSAQCWDGMKTERPELIFSETGRLRHQISTLRGQIDRQENLAWSYLGGFVAFGLIPLFFTVGWRFLLNRIRELGDAVRGK